MSNYGFNINYRCSHLAFDINGINNGEKDKKHSALTYRQTEDKEVTLKHKKYFQIN